MSDGSELRSGLWTIRCAGGEVNPRAQELLNSVIRGFLRKRLKLPWGGDFVSDKAGAVLTDAKYAALSELEWRRGACAAESRDACVRVVPVGGAKPHFEVCFREERVCGGEVDEELLMRSMMFAVAKVVSGQAAVVVDEVELPRVCDYDDSCMVYDMNAFREGRKS